MKMSDLDENQMAPVNQLFQLCGEKITTISSMSFIHSLSNIQFLPDVDNKMKRIDCFGIGELDIPILMEFLASPRADGQQRVIHMHFLLGEVAMAKKLLDAIKEVWKSIWPCSSISFLCPAGVPYINPTAATTIFPPIPNI
jgi:hypothetical protein